MRESVGRVLEDTGATLIVVEHRTEIWADLLTRVIVLAADGGLLADGTPGEVFGRYGDVLADAGVWVPGRGLPLPVLASVDGGAADAVLETDRLTISRDGRTAVQSGLDLSVPRGAATVITGSNGAGKSTLALTLAGLLPELDGTVTAASDLTGRSGRRPARWTSRELLTRIGTVFQEPEHQFLARTLRDELAVGPRALKKSDAEVDAIVDDLLERLQLAPLGLANPFTLSGGQKRRLSVATVLASAPQVIVLDEPTFGQDRRGWVGIMELLQEEIASGRTVVAVSHDAAVVRHLGGSRIELAAATEDLRGAGR
ncbi:hypothetical protein GCM10025863_28780 [Microbacterium suwonense]|uniref:ABC transporter domain-containing protein n=1 Tax=Microbacterium suwonense TaxID=683047 RepID=A0ABM8FX36_9MICO|nr:hypothetical protein GCM10025863_28780 [Microbacterium suwonense]